MIWNIFHLIFPIVFIILPMLCYKKSGRLMSRFYRHMLYSRGCRKLYTRLILEMLLLYHFIYMAMTNEAIDLALTSLLCVVLFSHQKSELILDKVKDNRIMFASVIIALLAPFIPHLYPLSMSLAILLLGAAFYPSASVRDTILHGEMSDGKLVELYYKR
jgi:hypothetical protein